jgi:RhtB (resistance to homoserine/threonine) family protein
VGVHLVVFVGVSAVVILLPGPDTAVVTKNILVSGRRAGLGTSIGVCTGLSVWTLAAALGVASVLRASEAAFTALKLVGAAYLVWLGVQAFRAARHAAGPSAVDEQRTTVAGSRRGFRQGLLSNLANPKIAVFFTSLLPQFVDPGRSVLLPFLMLGLIFVLMTFAWLCTYSLLAARAAAALQRPRVKATLDRITGTILIAVGIRLVLERR